MDKVRLFSAHFFSIALHPLFMPLYGLMILYHSYLSVFIPSASRLFIFLGVFVFTLFLPVLAHLILLRSGKIHDLDIRERKERTLPYIISLSCYILCVLFLIYIGSPLWVISFFIGASFSLLLLMLITLKWKISAHLSGIGGLMGSIMGVSFILHINPYELFMLLVLLAGALGFSRIELKAHTFLQTIAGFMLGFTCLFLSIIFIA